MKCCFLVPYFGKLPKTFPVFLKTCEHNKAFTWIVFTDDRTEYEYPENVKAYYMSFDELKDLVVSKFDFKIALDKPYKLCDFKPAYGYIFEEYIKGYDFWGHCDIDVIMGNLGKFITDELLEKYDKLFCLGHMILYRNTYENNRVFMKEVDGIEVYKKAFSMPEIAWFDEVWKDHISVNTIFLKYGKRVFMEDWSCNFYSIKTEFVKVTYNSASNAYERESYVNAVYLWDHGECYRLYKKDGKLCRDNIMYMHFQAREMKYNPTILERDIFKVVPNYFDELEVDKVTEENFEKVKNKRICFHLLQFHYKRKKKRILKILKMG